MAMEIPSSGHANEHANHMKYWAEVKHKAEECVKHVLEGGNHRTTLEVQL